MNIALKKITARAKALKKKHPGKKYKTLQKQAGKEYKAGKLRGAVGSVRKKARKKSVRKPIKPRKRKAAKPRSIGAKRRKTVSLKNVQHVIVKRRGKKSWQQIAGTKRAKRKYKVTHRVRRVSGTKSNLLPLLIGGAVLLGAAYFMLRPKAPAVILTSNLQRNAAGNSLLTAMTAAGLAANLISKIMDQFNNSDDATAINLASNPGAAINAAGGDPNAATNSWLTTAF